MAALLVGALVGLFGCAPKKELMKERTLSLREVSERVRQRGEAIRTLRGEGVVTVEAQERSNRGSFDVNLRKPDSVRIDFSGPFGLDVGTLALTRDNFVFYNRMENAAVTGVPDSATLNKLLNVSMGFEEILSVFTGELALAGPEDSLLSFGVQEGEYVASFRDGMLVKEIRVDGDAFVVTSFLLTDSEGISLVAANASRVTGGEIPMPKLLRVIFPSKNRSITIAYDSFELNGEVDCSFALPPGVENVSRE